MQSCNKCRQIVKLARKNAHKYTRTIPTRNVTSKSDSYKYDLDTDTSWEADYIRKQKKYLERIEKGEIKESFPSIFDSKKIYDLPHLIFEDKKTDEVDVTRKRTSNIDPDFARPEVYSLLTNMSGFDLDKIFSRMKEKRQMMPLIKYLTDEQLKEERERIELEAREKMRIVPVMLERIPINKVVETRPEINGHEHAPIVFTDVSEDIKIRDRFITIREVDGTLRKATWEERDRCAQIYFPKKGRQVIPPPMFEKDNLETALMNNSPELILLRTEMQFDLDSADFIRVSEAVYNHINLKSSYNELRSTKFFGSMAFYLTKNKEADELLKDMLKRKLLDHAADLVKLFTLLHPQSKTAAAIEGHELDNINLIQMYISNDCKLTNSMQEILNKIKKSSQ